MWCGQSILCLCMYNVPKHANIWSQNPLSNLKAIFTAQVFPFYLKEKWKQESFVFYLLLSPLLLRFKLEKDPKWEQFDKHSGENLEEIYFQHFITSFLCKTKSKDTMCIQTVERVSLQHQKTLCPSKVNKRVYTWLLRNGWRY